MKHPDHAMLAELPGSPKKGIYSTAARLATIREKKSPVTHPSETRVPLSTASKLALIREKKEQAARVKSLAVQQDGAATGRHFIAFALHLSTQRVIEGTDVADKTLGVHEITENGQSICLN